MQVESIRSRLCRCGTKLLLQITKEDGEIVGVSTTDDPETRTTVFLGSRNLGHARYTWELNLRYMQCTSCKARVQVRTFDKFEGNIKRFGEAEHVA